MVNENEIKSLIQLLDDTDAEIHAHVEAKLISIGTDVIPKLEEAWEHSLDAVLQQRLENVIHKIQFEHTKQSLQTWAISGAFDLLQGILIINKYQYADLDEQKIINQIEAIKREVWLQLGYEMSPLEKVKIINYVFYQLQGFSGNTVNYQDPQNSYLNLVLESRKGNQISLAIIYSIVAQKLDIPIYGVNLPQHFILAYIDENEEMLPGFEKDNGVLFYINPFNKGFVFGRKDVDYFLKQLNLESKREYYTACSNTEICKRVLRNLIGSYEKLGYSDKVEEVQSLLSVLEEKE